MATGPMTARIATEEAAGDEATREVGAADRPLVTGTAVAAAEAGLEKAAPRS